MPILIRPAEKADVSLIVELVNRYAGQDIMLPRTEESVRNTLEDWLVAVDDAESRAIAEHVTGDHAVLDHAVDCARLQLGDGFRDCRGQVELGAGVLQRLHE